MNKKCVEGLYSLGHKIHLDLFNIPDMRATVPMSDSMSDMVQTEVDPKADSVWAVMPLKLYPREGKKILFTMIETGKVHPSFVQKINFVDELWVPSRFNFEIFSAEKIVPNLQYMPLGVDIELYRPMILTQEQKDSFKIRTKEFVFSSLFGWSLRKGYDVLLKAYLKAFTSADDVSLVIASRKMGSTSEEMIRSIRDEIKEYILKYCSDPKKAPHIVHIGQCMKEEDIPILMNMSDCFCLYSRGEGMGLPYMEAGSCEVPVIATRCGGQLDFLNDDNSYLIDTEGYAINKDISELSSYYQGMPFSVLNQKTVDISAETMKHVYNNPNESREKAKRLRKNIVDNFTWDHLARRISKRIGS